MSAKSPQRPESATSELLPDYLPLITDGMELIAGQQANTALEVGLDTDLVLDRACVFAIIDCPRGSIKDTDLSIDKDRHLLHRGEPVEYGYAVFSLRSTKIKPDFGAIPELRNRYAVFQAAIKVGNKLEARDALTAFRLAALLRQISRFTTPSC